MIPSVARVVIADDERLARDRLRQWLQIEKDIRLVGEAANGPEAVALIRKFRPHIALLDIRLPGLNGFEVLETLGVNAPPGVIFITAYAEHALDAFQAGAVDYLLKPFEPKRLSEALRQARHRADARLGASPLLPPIEHGTPGRISLRVAGRIMLVALDEIEYVAAANNRCQVFTQTGSWLVSDSLGELAKRLPTEQFVRISRFALVNVARIVALTTKSHGDQIIELRSGVQVTVARTRRSEVLARLHRQT